jgi:hypothetical protein
MRAHVPRWWRGSPDGLVGLVAREDGAVSTGTAGVAGASGSEIDRRISDGQHWYLDREILTGYHTNLTCVDTATANFRVKYRFVLMVRYGWGADICDVFSLGPQCARISH